MAYQVLARKWRPKKFSEVKGQDHVVQTLTRSIGAGRIGHAYLLTGTRGVGKTTIARIFAKAIRCENRDKDNGPCLVCPSCLEIENTTSLDYMEVDGASNNSVDHIRELVENVQYMPAHGKYKVYVIDEVHMLSVSAFNALLKTLEEPPAHVVFIFATTDPQKLLGTVISRCQRFDFRPIELGQLEEQVKFIAGQENIKFQNPELITLLCKSGRGSLRDTLSLLDQTLSLSENNIITTESLTHSLGIAGPDVVDNILFNILSSDIHGFVQEYKKLTSQSVELDKFLHQLLDRLFTVIEIFQAKGSMPLPFDRVELAGQKPLAELMWIYESLAKDVSWTISSTAITNNAQLILSKIALRKFLFGAAKEVEAIQKKKIEIEQTAKVEILVKPEMTWEKFIAFVFERSKTIAVNLERGNILSPLNLMSDEFRLEIFFKEDNHIFREFLLADEAFKQLKNLASEYFEKSEDKISLKLLLIESQQSEAAQFRSNLELEEEKQRDAISLQKEKIEQNAFVAQAKQLFDARLSKIVLNNE